MPHGDLEMLGRLALATLLGGLIGLERETRRQPAGLRTHMVVSIGSCLIMLVSLYMWKEVDPERADPARIAAQVVTGIGFLGAGAILRYGISVRGLTTAAALWTASGIGLAVGAGYWKAAVAATGFTIMAIFVFDKFEKSFLGGKSLRRFVVYARDGAGLVGRIESLVQQAGAVIKEVDIQRDVLEGKIQVTFLAGGAGKADVDALSRTIGTIPEVEKVEID